MAQGHFHYGGPGTTQNQGNMLGDRPAVKLSAHGKAQNAGSSMAAIMGGEGYGQPEPAKKGRAMVAQQPNQQQVQQQEAPRGKGTVQNRPQDQMQHSMQHTNANPTGPGAPPIAMKAHRPGAGQANKQTFNLFGGE